VVLYHNIVVRVYSKVATDSLSRMLNGLQGTGLYLPSYILEHLGKKPEASSGKLLFYSFDSCMKSVVYCFI